MRIVHLLNHVRRVGNGIVNVAVDLACRQGEAGHAVAVASAGGEYEALLAAHGVEHWTLDQTRRPLTLLRAAAEFRRRVRRFRPQIVHAHMMTGAVLARALRGGLDYRTVTTVHNEFQRSAVLMGLGDRVIAVSEAVRQAMIRRGVPAAKLRVVRNGPLGSPRAAAAGPVAPAALHRPAVLTVSGLYWRKGIGDLITAFGLVAPERPEAHLYLVGDGPDRPALEQVARASAAAGRIHFEGFQAEPQRYLAAADIFVLASHREAFGLVLPEARAAGLAVVATDVDGIPEALEHGQAGLLVPPQDSRALAEALRRLLADPECRRDWQERAGRNLDWLRLDRVLGETLEVYRELAGPP